MTSGFAVAQRWLQAVVTDPDGVDAALARTGSGAHDGRLEPGAVVNGSAALSARDRLALYGRAYRMRLTGCLRESHPGLRHALGDELFDDFALDYLRARPSRSYTLATLGADWPAHLEATRPDADLPAGERESWPDFLVDLARLEQTFLEVYDAAGNEGREPPSVSALGPDAVVTPVVCLRLLELRFPADEYLVAVRRGEDPPLPAPAPSFVAVSRRDYVVTIIALEPPSHRLLEALATGVPLADAARVAAVALPPALLLVADWVQRGLIATIEVPGPPIRGDE
jgi:putative DNA-binding protein